MEYVIYKIIIKIYLDIKKYEIIRKLWNVLF